MKIRLAANKFILSVYVVMCFYPPQISSHNSNVQELYKKK